MARINLLPWRDARRKEVQRQFGIVAAGSAFITAAVIAYIHFHIAGLIDTQNRRNTFMEEEIKQVERDIAQIKNLESDKANLLARMKIIQQLQSARPEIVHLFYETATTLPEGVYLTTLKRTRDSLKIEGVAESNANVSNYMRNLDGSDWLTRPMLDVIDATKKEYSGLSWFDLRVSQSKPKTDEEIDAEKAKIGKQNKTAKR